MRFVECTYRTWEYIATETLFLCVLLACALDSVALWRDGKMGKKQIDAEAHGGYEKVYTEIVAYEISNHWEY